KYPSRVMKDCTLMKSTHLALRSSTALRPSSAVEIETELEKRDLGPSSMGPEMIIRGPRIAPLEVCERHCRRVSRSPPMSRMPVTPLATKSGRDTSFPPGIQSPKMVCTCMSHKPGIRNLLRPSTIFVLGGKETLAVLPTYVIRSPLIITIMPGWTGEPVASMTLTLRNTIIG